MPAWQIPSLTPFGIQALISNNSLSAWSSVVLNQSSTSAIKLIWSRKLFWWESTWECLSGLVWFICADISGTSGKTCTVPPGPDLDGAYIGAGKNCSNQQGEGQRGAWSWKRWGSMSKTSPGMERISDSNAHKFCPPFKARYADPGQCGLAWAI